MPLNDLQKRLADENTADFSDLKALFINTTLKPSDRAASHTEDLMQDSLALMDRCGVGTEYLRAADFNIAFGVSPDMRKEGAAVDDWPEKIWPKVSEADILVIGSPIWLGEESSICRLIIERLYAHSGQRNAKDQYIYYGKVGGAVITGNEDGIKHVAKTVLYSLQHVGYAIPPQADCGWIGEAGPGPSYGDETEGGKRAGYDSAFTRRNLTFMTFNLMHMARMLRDAGGLPDHGNQTTDWA
ncbi:NAD(P)H-dependent oxidoreductase [Nitratireductor rhodophyticola]|uniref:flavodoxin family protein n=1 Tax=Nitratireductor rhodophyticola TaxID=2854036 RepID=UPI0008141202|nr:NAD(P)H-dependent oxidoreductase [Nitratireductor rhodophyticola]MEC9243187.1 NAD(P)H-dependent oxidoreductase [Pseudomonadota bacterium]WPZ14093.1 NAD(P)H-dependent oxidoreductase [Nitratireductor rhodophyticola]